MTLISQLASFIFLSDRVYTACMHSRIDIMYQVALESRNKTSTTLMADTISWDSFMHGVVIFVLMMSCFRELYSCTCQEMVDDTRNYEQQRQQQRACEEIYVVREGETLHTISEKCGDPFIVENNPHIHDPDDVFPGLVIKISPFLV